MVHVAPASTADIPALCQLLSILFNEESDFTPSPDKQARGLAQIMAFPDRGRILVLRDADAVIGMANLVFTISTACGGKAAMLEDVIVHPDRRREGLGRTLLDAVVETATKEGCLRITLLTDRANDGAIRFYQRHGFTLSEMIPLRKMLDQDTACGNP